MGYLAAKVIIPRFQHCWLVHSNIATKKEPAASGDVLFSQWQFTVKESTLKIPYTRSPTAYNVIPAKEILLRKTPATLLEAHHVLVGSVHRLSDRLLRQACPFTGVMVHAEAASALLDQGKMAEDISPAASKFRHDSCFSAC